MIDSHQHFWQLGRFDYPWMSKDQYVVDTAATFIACADNTPAGAHVFNLHRETVAVDSGIRCLLRDLPSTPFETGIRETMKRFATLRDAARLDTSDLT